MTSQGWVEGLFLKFSTMYGDLWTRRWADVPAEAVQSEWAEELERFDTPTIKRALAWCRGNQSLPPTLPEFAKICAQYRSTVAQESYHNANDPRLPFNATDAKAAVADVARGMRRPRDDPHDWAKDIIACHAAGTYQDAYGLRCARDVLGIVVERPQ